MYRTYLTATLTAAAVCLAVAAFTVCLANREVVALTVACAIFGANEQGIYFIWRLCVRAVKTAASAERKMED